MRQAVRLATILVALAVFAVAPVVAQNTYDNENGVTVSFAPDLVAPDAGVSNAPDASNEWGINDYVAFGIPGVAFQPQWDAQFGHFANGAIYENSSSTARWFHGSFWLPDGVQISGTTPYYYDTNASLDVEVYLYHCAGAYDASCTLLDTRTSTGTGGWQAGFSSLDSGAHTVDNYDNGAGNSAFYRIYLHLSSSASADTSLRFKGVTLWYLRQISPAPASATFSDVPVGAFGFKNVEALVASGITAGCGGSNFCPNQPLTRVQMAVFLSKALGLHWKY